MNSALMAKIALLKADDTLTILDRDAISALGEDMGSQELQSLLRAFGRNIEEYRQTIFNAVEHAEVDRVKRAAHTLQGLCMQFGAVRLAALARSVEVGAADLDTASLGVFGGEATSLIRMLESGAPLDWVG